MIQISSLSKSYYSGTNELPVLRDISLSITPGEIVSIMGPSGAGKSTLLNVIGCLDSFHAGTIALNGRDVTRFGIEELAGFRNRNIGFIFQMHNLLPEFTALENVAMPLFIRRMARDEAEARARAMLVEVGLWHRLDHTPSELSGGERQRAAIARALVTEPACVLADEPTGNLDRQTAEGVFELMLELNRARRTSFVIVTHDPGLAARAERTLTLRDGAFLPD